MMHAYLCDLSIRRYKYITCTQIALLVFATIIGAAIVFPLAVSSISSHFAIFLPNIFEWSPELSQCAHC